MASVLAYPRDLYDYVWSFRDTRIDAWSSNVIKGSFVLPLIISYVYVAKVAGPRWMKGREPYNVKRGILAYNAFTVLANAYFLYRMLPLTYFGGGYSFLCQGMGTNSERDMMVISLNWWYLFVRIADFADTMFFVVRKKYTHITQLHVSHHALVVFSGWLWINFGSDGQAVLGICINAFVHVIMYTYYFLAALGPGLQKYLWWKKYLTTIQILQLVAVCTHSSLPLIFDCSYPKALCYLEMAQLVLGIVLFVNFYLKTYRVGGRSGPPLAEVSKEKDR
ncbi:very long chain fatty acid elongase AAEL008004-like [Dermacentor andersoni]|uniref:very long chain fatty acid elongase AAEL008004-like n=1 Tax=Dermacentor andersoni TaxID=34620 RepID=UPI002155B249|nr:elongation of very long chain fatty acids protein AAEL008004-like [Dermacentor andersoni]